MTNKGFSFAAVFLATILLISNPLWGQETIPDYCEIYGPYASLRLTDTTTDEADWSVATDLIVKEAFTIANRQTGTYPFFIQTGAPTYSIIIKPDGKVGMGTGSPSGAVEVARTGENVLFVVNRTDGARCGFLAKVNQFFLGTSTNHPVIIAANNTWITKFNPDGTLNMSDGGSYTGTWNDASSREYKENIETLSAEEALEAFQGLSPVKYNYREHKEEPRLGFIAEDVPELVSMNGRKNLSPMDMVAVLTKVLQEQQKINEEQQKVIQEQQKTISDLNERVAEIEKR